MKYHPYSRFLYEDCFIEVYDHVYGMLRLLHSLGVIEIEALNDGLLKDFLDPSSSEWRMQLIATVHRHFSDR